MAISQAERDYYSGAATLELGLSPEQEAANERLSTFNRRRVQLLKAARARNPEHQVYEVIRHDNKSIVHMKQHRTAPISSACKDGFLALMLRETNPDIPLHYLGASKWIVGAPHGVPIPEHDITTFALPGAST